MYANICTLIFNSLKKWLDLSNQNAKTITKSKVRLKFKHTKVRTPGLFLDIYGYKDATLYLSILYCFEFFEYSFKVSRFKRHKKPKQSVVCILFIRHTKKPIIEKWNEYWPIQPFFQKWRNWNLSRAGFFFVWFGIILSSFQYELFWTVIKQIEFNKLKFFFWYFTEYNVNMYWMYATRIRGRLKNCWDSRQTFQVIWHKLHNKRDQFEDTSNWTSLLPYHFITYHRIKNSLFCILSQREKNTFPYAWLFKSEIKTNKKKFTDSCNHKENSH